MVEVQPALAGNAFAIPRSPRRTLREITAARLDRDALRAQREIRQLEVERELRKQLNLGDDESNEKSVSEDGAPPEAQRVLDSLPAYVPQARYTLRSDAGSTHSEGWTPTGHLSGTPVGCSGRPRSRPQSASGRGPPRPPKPKPHRPLTLSEPRTDNTGSQEADVAFTCRWKSALLPVWHDRGGVANTSMAASATVDMTKMVAPAVVHTSQAFESSSHTSSYPLMSWMSFAADNVVGASIVSTSGRASPSSERDETCSSSIECDASPSSESRLSQDLPDCSVTQPARSLASCASPRKHDTLSPSHRLASAGAEITHRSHVAAIGQAATPPTVADYTPAITATKPVVCAQGLQVSERTRQLEENTRKLRENAERLRLEKTRHRVFGPSLVEECAIDDHGLSASSQGGASSRQPPEIKISTEESKRIQEMRRKIAHLDAVNELERLKLEQEEREMEDRRRAQEAFEQRVQENTDRALREHHRLEAREEQERARTKAEEQREREERERRRLEQQQHEQEESDRKQEQRRNMRSDMYQMRFDQMEDELDRQWAEQEVEERRNLAMYAAQRQKQYEAWDKTLNNERQRFASAAEFTEAARHHKARVAASADERFYAGRRGNTPAKGFGARHTSGPGTPKQQTYTSPPPLGKPNSNMSSSAEMNNLSPEERQVLKDLQGVKGANRELQKAKVKELLLRWHPDKNPTCTEKATRVFQFVQKQRESILGL